jgi:hypothetical protein
MKTSPLENLVLTLLFALLLIAFGCGGGASAGGGIGGSGIISQGSVSAFGSIVVNGTAFDTSNATIIIEGEEIGVGDIIAQDNLDVGRVVTVYGTDGINAVADRVTYKDNVEGPVEDIIDNVTSKEIKILGQRVIVNFITEFKGTMFGTIALGDVVEVSGLFDDTGTIWATFVEKTGGVIFEVKGFVENLDTVQETFKINDLTVDYSSIDPADLPEDFADGLLVEVEGPLDPTGVEMVATEINLGDGLEVEDANEIEVTGFVTDATLAPAEVTIGNQVVQTDADTVFVDGTAADIAPGVKLEAGGSLVNGILFADEIEFWGPDQIEVEGLVTDDALAPAEFTVGTQVVQTDADTVFEDGTPAEIVLGVMLEVKGVPVDIDRSILVADKVSFE